MIEGPVGNMVGRSQARQSFNAPPNLMDVRPMAMEHPEASIILLTCSDPRLSPEQMVSLNEIAGDGQSGPIVSVVRVPGGRAAHAIKPLSTMQGALNSGTIVVIHHTDCGLTHLTDQDCRDYLISIAPEDKSNIEKTKFGEIRGTLEESIKEDLQTLRASSWIQKSTRLIGLKYDTHTGVLHEVGELKP